MIISFNSEISCPECHHAFKQVGALKCHIKRFHDIPWEPEDVYDPLRDAWNGRPICNHCSHSFIDFYRLRDHINRPVCTSFKILRYLKILELERFPCALCRGTWHHILMVTDRFSDGFRTGRYVRS